MTKTLRKRSMVGRQRVTDVGLGTRRIAIQSWSARFDVRDGSSNVQQSPHALTPRDGLDARRRRIWGNGTLAEDMNVDGSDGFSGCRRLNRVRRLGDQSGSACQRRQDSSVGTVRRLHGARRRTAARLVAMHRAHGTWAMSARAFHSMRVRGGDPQCDGYERDGPDLAQQPDGRERHESPTQMGHQRDLIP